MSDMSSFTGRFRVRPNPDTSGSRVTKRSRPLTVCTLCRRSKQKCNRSQPCDNCLRRGQPDLCTYDSSSTTGGDDRRSVIAEEKLSRLETAVKQLLDDQARQQGHRDVSRDGAPITPPAVQSDPASLQPTETESIPGVKTFAGSTHWSSILEDIQELKTTFSTLAETAVNESVPPEETNYDEEPVFGLHNFLSTKQVIDTYLPQKVEADRLLALYFRGRTFVTPFIHTYHFQRQYREFWQDPLACNPLWLSILFSVCFVGSLVDATKTAESPDDLAIDTDSLRIAAGHCLVLGRYYQPQPLAPEALMIYAHCKNMKTLDPSREAATILSMAIRLAYEMGYHRENTYKMLSPFDAEMRRRAWSTGRQMDVMMSFMLGLPSTIDMEASDTLSPRNLNDEDFDNDTKVLPESRPEFEPTKILWFIVKERLIPAFGKVCKDALSLKDHTDNEIDTLNHEVRKMHTSVPEILRYRPLSDSIMDDPFTIMSRLYINFIYLKTLCVLHRKYMLRGRQSSSTICVEAALRLVDQFVEMYKEFSPGGILNPVRWMLGNFTMNDFLLGVMILCLYLQVPYKTHSGTSTNPMYAHDQIGERLEHAHRILTDKSALSKDAQRVAIIVRHVLDQNNAAGVPALAEDSSTAALPDRSAEKAGSEVWNLDTAQPSTSPQEPFNTGFDEYDPFSFLNTSDVFDWSSESWLMRGEGQ